MGLKTIIYSQKNGNQLAVEEDGSLNVYIIPKPSSNNIEQPLPFVQYLKLNGTGTSSMLVDGSVNHQDFFVPSYPNDVYINTLVFEITDSGATLNKFGNLTALTNGIEFYYFNQREGKYVIEDSLKSNYDFIKLANFQPAFGSGTAAFQLPNTISLSESYVGVIDIEDIFGLQWGLKLRANSTDRIGFIIKDDITGIDAMTIKAYGIRL